MGRCSAFAQVYRGRFAPSPTGPLHFGSLLAAIASFVDARASAGTWLVRIENLDRPREVPGAAEQILRALTAFGLEWDEPVVYQSERGTAYDAALKDLEARGFTYACGCSRADIARQGPLGVEGPVYPGTCRRGLPPGREPRSLRVLTDSIPIGFVDHFQGQQSQAVERSTGDFVLRRADGIHAYQLAVVVDDAWQGVTHVVRGADLLDSTPRQIYLQRALGLPEPTYAHIPVVVDEGGQKLSKSLAAAPVDPGDPLPAMQMAWAALGQEKIRRPGSPTKLLREAARLWDPGRVPRTRRLTLSDLTA